MVNLGKGGRFARDRGGEVKGEEKVEEGQEGTGGEWEWGEHGGG